MNTKQRQRLVRHIARIAERAYRRGFQQGHDVARRGDRLESEARSQLRGLVIEAAEEPLVLKEAREQAYVMMTTLVKAAIAPFAPDLEIEVRLDAGLTPQEGTEAWPDSAPLS